jgi:cell division protein ZapA
MAQVDVTINTRSYTLACADGEEARLRQLSEYLDGRMTKLARAVGNVGESRLFLLVALTLADELAETTGKLNALSREARPQGGAQALDMAALAGKIEQIARRIEGLADKVAA